MGALDVELTEEDLAILDTVAPAKASATPTCRRSTAEPPEAGVAPHRVTTVDAGYVGWRREGAASKEAPMPKYLFEVQYNVEGLRGLKSQGGTARVEASPLHSSKRWVATLESFHFAFGRNDAYLIAELPSNVATAAVDLIARQLGVCQRPGPPSCSRPKISTRPRRRRPRTVRPGD